MTTMMLMMTTMMTMMTMMMMSITQCNEQANGKKKKNLGKIKYRVDYDFITSTLTVTVIECKVRPNKNLTKKIKNAITNLNKIAIVTLMNSDEEHSTEGHGWWLCILIIMVLFLTIIVVIIITIIVVIIVVIVIIIRISPRWT